MASIKLVYFDIRGRAEFIRLVLEAAGQEYEDERVQFADWPTVKPSLYGKTNLDGLRIDEVHGLWEDQMQNIAEFLRKALEEDLPKYFGFYEKMLKDNGGSGYLVGNSVSLGDFYLYDMQDNLLQLKKDALKDYPLMQKLRQNVESQPLVKAYLARRKETIF
ncbi:hypothetical protein BaRGS_00023653 [Batillaria attramentaria]|uniref:Glutathione S-transferase n=1 Tax=Batillaria attramentaria TaxID=370345 RepID=A0ABD0KDB2_9CAEN